MSWSMNNISFRMAGSGSWQNLLPDEAAKQLYGQIYPEGRSLSAGDDPIHPYLEAWERGGIIRIEGQRAVPTGPVITDNDLDILDAWFRDISDTMCTAIWDHLPEYQIQAKALAGKTSGTPEQFDNILTIQICAHTLDSWVFSYLREAMMGTYSPRDFAGTFFFWGYGFAHGAKRIFGFTTYGGSTFLRLHVLRSHGLDRERLKTALRQYATMDYLQGLLNPGLGRGAAHRQPASPETERIVDSLRQIKIITDSTPPRLAIPIFTEEAMQRAVQLYQSVTEKIVGRFISRMDDLKLLIEKCSFARCLPSDVLCMLFHLSYSYAADALVEKGTIPEFPQGAGAEWGVWVH